MVELLTVSAVGVAWAGIGFSLFGIVSVQYWQLCMCLCFLLCPQTMTE